MADRASAGYPLQRQLVVAHGIQPDRAERQAHDQKHDAQ